MAGEYLESRVDDGSKRINIFMIMLFTRTLYDSIRRHRGVQSPQQDRIEVVIARGYGDVASQEIGAAVLGVWLKWLMYWYDVVAADAEP